jgi:hypothetical protein
VLLAQLFLWEGWNELLEQFLGVLYVSPKLKAHYSLIKHEMNISIARGFNSTA